MVKKFLFIFISLYMVITLMACDGSTANVNNRSSSTENISNNDKEFGNTTNENKYYTITFKNDNGEILSSNPYKEGSVPVYDGTPSKDATNEYTYFFNGWSPSITSVTKDCEYVATYKATKNRYTIIWKNWDGQVLEEDTNIEFGVTPIYNGEIPNKKNDDGLDYEFTGWSPEISPVFGTQVYKATFAVKKSHLITFVDWNGEVLQQTIIKNGEMPIFNQISPTKETDGEYLYKFIGWSPKISAAKEDCTYIAEYSKSKINDSQFLKYELDSNGESYILSGLGDCTDEIIKIPSSINNIPVKGIKDFAFYNAKIKGIILSNLSNFTIGQGAFSGCSKLEYVFFISCENLIMDKSSFSSTKFINDNSNYVDGILYINDYLLTAKDTIVGEIKIKEGTKYVCDYAFENNSTITKMIFPSSVRKLGNYAFSNCQVLKCIEIENDGVIEINKTVFNDTPLEQMFYNEITLNNWKKTYRDEYYHYSRYYYYKKSLVGNIDLIDSNYLGIDRVIHLSYSTDGTCKFSKSELKFDETNENKIIYNFETIEVCYRIDDTLQNYTEKMPTELILIYETVQIKGKYKI